VAYHSLSQTTPNCTAFGALVHGLVLISILPWMYSSHLVYVLSRGEVNNIYVILILYKLTSDCHDMTTRVI